MWKPSEHKPLSRVPVLMKGTSEHISPTEIIYISGFYEAAWMVGGKDKSIRAAQAKFVPREWMYLAELESEVREYMQTRVAGAGIKPTAIKKSLTDH